MLKSRGRSPSTRKDGGSFTSGSTRGASQGPHTPNTAAIIGSTTTATVVGNSSAYSSEAEESGGGMPHSPRDPSVINPGSSAAAAGGAGSAGNNNNLLVVDDACSVHTSPAHSAAVPGADVSDYGGNSIWYDELDNSVTGLDPAAKIKAMDQLQKKITRTRDQIKAELLSKEGNVDEYLRVSSSADKHQLVRIKQVFEKKNQKSAQTIAQLQKKLENYQRKARDIGQHGTSGKQPKEVLKAVGQGIKSVGGGVVGTLVKPKEFAHRIRNKFGSADNIPSHIAKERDDDERRSHHGSASLPREGSTGGAGSILSEQVRQSSYEIGCASDDGHLSVPRSPSSITSESERGGEVSRQDVDLASPRNSATNSLGLNTLMSEINNLREETERLREELDEQRQTFKQELDFVNGQLREERYRCERLEEQIHDLTEFHQNEMENVRTGVTDMEEKVQYQSEERVRDIQDQLSGLETKISRMEHQAQQHQQYVTFEGLENSNARALVVKAINIILTLLQVVLLILETGAQILKPFLKTPTRVVTTFLLVTVTILAVRQWTEISLVVGKVKQDYRKHDLKQDL